MLYALQVDNVMIFVQDGIALCLAHNDAPWVVNLASLNGLDPVEHSLGNVAKSRRTNRNGDIFAFVPNAERRNSTMSASEKVVETILVTETHLLTALTMAAVPLPNTSLSLLSF